MAIKRVKLNYVAAVAKIPPAERVSVPNSHKEELNRSIKQKVRQNEAERAASLDVAGRYTVRGRANS